MLRLQQSTQNIHHLNGQANQSKTKLTNKKNSSTQEQIKQTTIEQTNQIKTKYINPISIRHGVIQENKQKTNKIKDNMSISRLQIFVHTVQHK